MAMFNEDKNLKSGGCADEIAALIRDDLSPKMIQEQLRTIITAILPSPWSRWTGLEGCG